MFSRHQSFGVLAGRPGGARAPASTRLAVFVAFVLLAGLASSGVGVRPAGASTEGRSIRISKYLCPDDLSYASAAQLDLADLYEPCGELGPGVTFQLTAEPGETQDAQTALNYFDFYLAIADFNDLDERTYTVQEVIPAGYTTPVVFCRVFYEGATSSSWEPVQVSDDGAFTLSMVDVNDVLCEWFNIVSTASDFAGNGGSGSGGTTTGDFAVADGPDADSGETQVFYVADDAEAESDDAQVVLVADGTPSPTPSPARRIVPSERD